MKRFITHFFIITLFTMVTYGQSGIKKPDWKEKNLVGKVKKMKEKMVFFDDKKQYVAFAKGEGSPSDIENVSITYVFNQRGYIESFISENGDKVPIKYDYRNRTATQIYKKKPGSPAMEIICEFDPLKNMISQTLKMGEQTITEKYKLTYNEKWQVVEEEEESFLTVPDLMSEDPETNSSNSELGDSNHHHSTRDWTPSDQDRQTRDSSSQGHQETSSSSQNQTESSSESSADNNPETLKRLKERLNKRQAKNSHHQSKSKHQSTSGQSKKEAKAKANSDQANESSQEKGKGSVKLPDTGEQAFYMTLALALCSLAALIVAIYLYRRYRERKKLKDIHFD